MVIVPRCHVCATGEILKGRKLAYRCCGCRRYICAKHHNPKKIKPEHYYAASFCTVCNPKEEKTDADELTGRVS